jgi:hypothetical protein
MPIPGRGGQSRDLPMTAAAMTAGPALSRLSSAPDAPRLLGLHHAGGNGAFYASWVARAVTDPAHLMEQAADRDSERAG